MTLTPRGTLEVVRNRDDGRARAEGPRRRPARRVVRLNIAVPALMREGKQNKDQAPLRGCEPNGLAISGEGRILT